MYGTLSEEEYALSLRQRGSDVVTVATEFRS